MADFNKVILIGRLGKDPESKATPTGLQIAGFSLATGSKLKDQQVTEWHNVTCFGKTAEFVSKYLAKGARAMVEGSIRYESWEKDGVKQYRTKIIASNVMSLSEKKEVGQTPEKQLEQAFDDFTGIPF